MYHTTTNQSLAIVLEGREQMWALRAKITIDKADITSITWHGHFNEWPRLIIRMPGSYFPKWLMAGSYWSDDGWDFVYAKNPSGMLRPSLDDVVVIETNKDRYRRIIVQLSKDEYNDLKTWFNEGKKGSRKSVPAK